MQSQHHVAPEGAVIKAWLITHRDGWELVMRNDYVSAEMYARANGATIEPLYSLKEPVPCPKQRFSGNSPLAFSQSGD